MMRHPYSTEELLALAVHEVSEGDLLQIQKHLAGCAECRATLALAYQTRDVLRSTSELEPPAKIIAHAKAIYHPLVSRQAAPAPRAPLTWFGWLQRGLVTAALLGMLLLVAAGMQVAVAAAADTLPGDSLYPVKLSAENIRLALAFGTPEQIRQHLAIAGAREQEIEELAAQGRTDAVPATDQSAQDHLQQAVKLEMQLTAADLSRAAELTPLLEQALDKHIKVLTALLDSVPPAARPGIEKSIAGSQTGLAAIEDLPLPHPTRTSADTVPALPTATRAPNNGQTGPRSTPPGADNNPGNPNATRTPPGQSPQSTPPGQSPQSTPPGQARTPAAQPPQGTPNPPGQNKTPDAPNPPGQNKTPVAPNSKDQK